MLIRDRVKKLRRVRAGDLLPHPLNWRTHPPRQRAALKGLLLEIGYADALLARELPDGSLQLVDGHLRAELTPNTIVPVLVLDLDDTEAEQLLVSLDPLSAMAETNQQVLDELLARTSFFSDDVNEVLGALSQDANSAALDPPEVDIPASYQLVVECRDEAQQQELFERLRSEGFKCRVLAL